MQDKRNRNGFSFAAHAKQNRWLLPLVCVVIAALLVVTLILTHIFGGTDGTSLLELKENGVLSVAILEDSRPYGWINGDGVAVGIEVDILKEVCKSLGVTPEFTVVSRDKALKGLDKGTYHLICGGLTSSVSAKQPLQYTNPYSNVQQMILCQIDGPYQGLSSLPTAKLAVKENTHTAWLAAKQNYTHTAYPTTAEAVAAVGNGTADAMLLDRWTAESITKGRHSVGADDRLVMLNAAITTAGNCFVMAPGSDDTVNEINVIVSRLAADGVLNTIFENHDALYYSPY